MARITNVSHCIRILADKIWAPNFFTLKVIIMELSALTAVSPLDGRYGRQTEALRDIFSEFAFMRARVTVEIEWLIALAEFNLPELKDLSEEDKLYLRGLVSSFSVEDCKAIKSIEIGRASCRERV